MSYYISNTGASGVLFTPYNGPQTSLDPFSIITTPNGGCFVSAGMDLNGRPVFINANLRPYGMGPTYGLDRN
jgi:hypothetical protein